MDLISKFNKGFENERPGYIQKEDKIIGALDNTLPNAILMNSIKII